MHFVYTEISNDYNFFRLKDEIFFQKLFWILDSLVLRRSCKKNGPYALPRLTDGWMDGWTDTQISRQTYSITPLSNALVDGRIVRQRKNGVDIRNTQTDEQTDLLSL